MAKTTSKKSSARSTALKGNSNASNGLSIEKVKTKLKEGSKPALAFVTSATFIEVALVGAAGFVLWKNREKIQAYLDEKGIDIPGAVSEKFGQWFGGNASEEDRSYTQ
jgi:hypothetical protein